MLFTCNTTELLAKYLIQTTQMNKFKPVDFRMSMNVQELSFQISALTKLKQLNAEIDLVNAMT